MEKYTDKPIILFQLSFFGGSLSSLLSLITDSLEGGSTAQKSLLTIVTPNPEQVVMTRNNGAFLSALQDASLRLPDGIGLVYASKLFAARFGTKPLHERIPGRVVVESLLRWAYEHKASVLVIGGRGLGDEAGKLLPVSLKNDQTLHSEQWRWSSGYENVSTPTTAEEQVLEETIQKVRPDIVFVAFGAPHQELWLRSHNDLLEKTGVSVAMVVGGTFDVLTGKLQRPPTWMEQSGLEWLYRLWQEPTRWRRQLKLTKFIGLTLGSLYVRKEK